jgi:hypothetical protein
MKTAARSGPDSAAGLGICPTEEKDSAVRTDQENASSGATSYAHAARLSIAIDAR